MLLVLILLLGELKNENGQEQIKQQQGSVNKEYW